MKKYVISIAIILVIVSYIISQKLTTNTSASANIPTNNTNTSATDKTSNNGGSSSGNKSKSGIYNDGSYIGSVADAFYGNIQVKAVIKSGKITDVQFLQYPNDRGNSIEINSYAMPILTQEAIRAQSSKVDIVSGATDTSAAFIQSLESALNKAKI
ncbi:MAG TPA: FMN-binding protein [Candidatus Dojkabacteria bacterium]|nr:FMN-binding protein [Candidatus Dojkabacteria bacterium]